VTTRAHQDTNARLREEIDGLRTALESRTMIGQAVGMLMERYKVDAETGFRALTRLSQERNVKVRDLAAAMTADPSAATAYPERSLGVHDGCP
jgi:AmiR/NasT family two-component response regulator